MPELPELSVSVAAEGVCLHEGLTLELFTLPLWCVGFGMGFMDRIPISQRVSDVEIIDGLEVGSLEKEWRWRWDFLS